MIDASQLSAIDGSERYGHFGWATTFSDLNMDGFDDLVVSAPMESAQQGRVYIWMGGTGFPSSGVHDASSSDICLQLPAPQSTESTRPRLGTVVSTLRATSSSRPILAVSAPRDASIANDSGAVFLLLSV